MQVKLLSLLQTKRQLVSYKAISLLAKEPSTQEFQPPIFCSFAILLIESQNQNQPL